MRLIDHRFHQLTVNHDKGVGGVTSLAASVASSKVGSTVACDLTTTRFRINASAISPLNTQISCVKYPNLDGLLTNRTSLHSLLTRFVNASGTPRRGRHPGDVVHGSLGPGIKMNVHC